VVVECFRRRPDREQFELVRLAPPLQRDLPFDSGGAELNRRKLIEPAFSCGKTLWPCLDLGLYLRSKGQVFRATIRVSVDILGSPYGIELTARRDCLAFNFCVELGAREHRQTGQI
jgi:hypothetical protein